MKYTIFGFQQVKLIELGLDTADALLLRTMKDLYSSIKMEYVIHNNNRYVWINKKYLLKQIPIIGSRRTLIRKIEKLTQLELIDNLFIHNKDGQKGNYSYYLITEKADNLTDYDNNPYAKMTQGLCQNDTRVMPNWHNKDNTIIDTSIIDKEYIGPAEPDQIPYKKIIDYLNEKTGKNYKATSTANRKLIKARYNEGYTFEDFCKVINIKTDEWLNNEMNKYLRPSTLFGTKFENYINEKEIKTKPKINLSNIGVKL